MTRTIPIALLLAVGLVLMFVGITLIGADGTILFWSGLALATAAVVIALHRATGARRD
jgi:hypothetical protein